MAEKLVTEFQQLVTQSGLKSALSRKRYSDKADVVLYRERRFAHLHEGTLLSGAFDRLVVESENGRDVRAEVIDFKSERLPVGVSAVEAAERYRMQLSQYCLVAERLTGPDCKIKGFILFIENGEMVEVLS